MKLDLLLDTHVLVWMATAPEKLPKRMRASIESSSRRFVSHVTALEIQLKNLKNAESFPFSLAHLELSMKEFACTELPIVYEDIRSMERFQTAHPDPFDRLLMAQASNRAVYLTTLDRDILRCFKRDRSFSILSGRAPSDLPHP